MPTVVHYRWVGVDSFFLRENGENCSIAEDLQAYQDAGILDLDVKPGPKHPTQTNWYNECAVKASKKHSWVAFIDLDEFMIILKKCASGTLPTASCSLPTYLRQPSMYPVPELAACMRSPSTSPLPATSTLHHKASISSPLHHPRACPPCCTAPLPVLW